MEVNSEISRSGIEKYFKREKEDALLELILFTQLFPVYFRISQYFDADMKSSTYVSSVVYTNECKRFSNKPKIVSDVKQKDTLPTTISMFLRENMHCQGNILLELILQFAQLIYSLFRDPAVLDDECKNVSDVEEKGILPYNNYHYYNVYTWE